MLIIKNSRTITLDLNVTSKIMFKNITGYVLIKLVNFDLSKFRQTFAIMERDEQESTRYFINVSEDIELKFYSINSTSYVVPNNVEIDVLELNIFSNCKADYIYVNFFVSARLVLVNKQIKNNLNSFIKSDKVNNLINCNYISKMTLEKLIYPNKFEFGMDKLLTICFNLDYRVPTLTICCRNLARELVILNMNKLIKSINFEKFIYII